MPMGRGGSSGFVARRALYCCLAVSTAEAPELSSPPWHRYSIAYRRRKLGVFLVQRHAKCLCDANGVQVGQGGRGAQNACSSGVRVCGSSRISGD